MHSTGQMGTRAALAVLMSLLLSYLLQSERSYWATIVTVAIVGETWGQSVQRAVERLGMTLLGGLAGWSLYSVLGDQLSVRVIVLFACVFLAVYARNRSYAWMTFFITLYVVFLFSVMGEFTPHLVYVRVVETAIGCGTALFSALVVRPPRASSQLSEAFRALWAQCEEQLRWSLERFPQPAGSEEEATRNRLRIYRALLALHAQRGISVYESLTPARAHRSWSQLLDTTRELCHTVITLQEALEALSKKPESEETGRALSSITPFLFEAFAPLKEGPAPRLALARRAAPESHLAMIETGARRIRRLTRRLQRQRRGIA